MVVLRPDVAAWATPPAPTSAATVATVVAVSSPSRRPWTARAAPLHLLGDVLLGDVVIHPSWPCAQVPRRSPPGAPRREPRQHVLGRTWAVRPSAAGDAE